MSTRQIIHILEDWYCTADRYQYTLLYKRLKQDAPNLGIKAQGEYVFEESGYYASIRSMLAALSDKIIRKEIEDGQLDTMQQILYRLDEIEKAIADFTD
jgi:hypothetical protein